MIALVLAAHAGPLGSGGPVTGTTPLGAAEAKGEAKVPAAAAGSETDDAAAAAGAVEPGDAAAAIVLGTTIDTVSRPSTATDLAISIGGAFEDGEVPTSYAVEVSPFWLGEKARELPFVEHARGGAGSLARNLNVSFAARNDATDGIAAALALRTTWWAPPGTQGKTGTSRFVQAYDAVFTDPTGARTLEPPDGAPLCVQSLHHLSRFTAEVGERVARKLKDAAPSKALAAQTAMLEACGEVDAAVLPKAGGLCAAELFATRASGQPADATRDAAALARLEALVAAKKKAEAAAATALDTLVKEAVADLKKDPSKLADPLEEHLAAGGFAEAFEGCDALLTRHQGWVVDVGTGASIASPDTSLAGLGGDAVHAWLTPGWVGDRESVFVLGRFKVEDLAAEPLPGVDVGLGLGYRWSRWALEAQGLVGLPILGRELAARATVGADLLLSKGLWFTTAVGGSLPPDAPGSFVALAGVKLAVTRERTFQTPTYADLAAVVP